MLAVASIVLTLAVVEVGFRVARALRQPITLRDLEGHRRQVSGREASLGDFIVASPDPVLVYEMIPNLVVRFGGEEVRINSAGFRDDEFQIDKPARTTRIAVVGDSHSFGWRVAQDDSYPEVLEQILSRFGDGRRIQVMNFGVPGYNTVMEHELLVKKVAAYHPDILILQFDSNDVDLPNFMQKPERLWRLDRSFLWDSLRDRWPGGRRPRPKLLGLSPVPSTKDPWGGYHFLFDPSRIPPEYARLAGAENCRAALREIARTAMERGMRLLFVLNPLWVENYEIQRQPYYAPFVETARDAGFLIVDPTPAIRAFLGAHGLTSEDLWVAPKLRDPHPSPARHSLIAMEIAKVLLETRTLPGPIATRNPDRVLAAFRARADAQISASSPP